MTSGVSATLQPFTPEHGLFRAVAVAASHPAPALTVMAVAASPQKGLPVLPVGAVARQT